MKAFSGQPGIYQVNPFGDQILVAFSGRQFPKDCRDEFLAALYLKPSQVFFLKQVHGNRILEIDSKTQDTNFEEADGFITQTKSALEIRTADCMPVFFADQDQKTIGLIHAGWRGLHQSILEKTVQIFKDRYQIKPEKIHVFIGPSIRACCYEVGEEFCGYFPETCSAETGEKPKMDLVQEAEKRLAGAGILKHQITDSAICTVCQNHLFFSARKEKTENRIFSVIQIK